MAPPSSTVHWLGSTTFGGRLALRIAVCSGTIAIYISSPALGTPLACAVCLVLTPCGAPRRRRRRRAFGSRCWATQAGYGAVTGDDDGEDSDSDSDDEGATGRRSKNGAFLVWQGTASRKTFSAFSFEECHSVDKARSYLAKRNCAHFFDQCLNYQPA